MSHLTLTEWIQATLQQLCGEQRGFAQKTGELLSHVAEHVLGDTAVTAAISGPSFAYEVVRGIPAGFDLASTSSERIESIADLFRSEIILSLYNFGYHRRSGWRSNQERNRDRGRNLRWSRLRHQCSCPAHHAWTC